MGPPLRGTMGDAISLGVRAFEGKNCLLGRPPGCILEGGRIDYDSIGAASCPECGMLAGLMVFDDIPAFDEEGRISPPLSKTGAKRGRKEARGRLFGGEEWEPIAKQYVLTDVGLVTEYGLTMNAQGETDRIYEEMLDNGYHLGGTGLDAAVHAAAWFGVRFDYNFVPMEKIVGGDSMALKKANSVVKRAMRDGVVKRIVADPLSILDSVLAREPRSKEVQEKARQYARTRVPGLRPALHAAGALYRAMHISGSSTEKKVSQADIGASFHISRKFVGQGYRALGEMNVPMKNPPDVKMGLTGSQVKLLRRLR